MPNPIVDTAPGDTTAPSAPTFTVTPYGKGVMLTITLAEPPDFAYYEVHKGLSAGAMSLFAQGRATQVPDTTVNYGVSVFYKVRAVDTSGNASAFSSTLSTTPATWATGDVSNNAITQLNWVITSSADVKDITSPQSNMVNTVCSLNTIGGPVLVTFNGSFSIKNNHGDNTIGPILYLTRNGIIMVNAITVLFAPATGTVGDLQWVSMSVSAIDAAPAALNTYRVEWAVNGGQAGDAVSALDRSIFCVELKR